MGNWMLVSSGETPIITTRRSYFDIDAYVEAVKPVNLEVYQLSPGRNVVHLQQSIIGDCCFLAASHAKSAEHLAYSVSEGFTFAIPEPTTDTINLQGKAHSIDTLVCIPPRAEFYAVGPDNGAVYSLTLSCDVLERAAHYLLPRGVTLNYPQSATLFPLIQQQADGLRLVLRHLKWLLGESSHCYHEVAVTEHLHYFVIPLLLGALTGTSLMSGVGKFGSYYPLSRVLSDIHDNLDSPPMVSELAAGVGISTRSLQMMFAKHIGHTPKSYIKAKRLDVVRKRLCGSPLTYGAISDAANEMGFWHLGQFAKDFKRQFGFRPRETRQLMLPADVS